VTDVDRNFTFFALSLFPAWWIAYKINTWFMKRDRRRRIAERIERKRLAKERRRLRIHLRKVLPEPKHDFLRTL